VTSLALNSPRDKNRLLRTIEMTLADFEPRLVDIRVRAVDDGTSAPRVLRFQIEGLLKMDPAPEQIFFDTLLQLSTGDCQVKVE
jgi:type VI secretion system protein ImpF